jgi:indole-3-glycerol phosphate synthase
LQDFSVSLDTTKELIEARKEIIIERNILIVSESGIHTPADVHFVQQAGAQAILVGESLVKQVDPAAAIANLLAL